MGQHFPLFEPDIVKWMCKKNYWRKLSSISPVLNKKCEAMCKKNPWRKMGSILPAEPKKR